MEEERKGMVSLIHDNYGLDSPRVLSVMLRVPRHKFVDDKYTDLAYQDRPVPIGYGQTMSQPYTVAYMTDLLNLSGDEKVLEVGTGSGYQAAVLSKLAKEVYSIEIVPQLAKKAKSVLRELGYKNVHLKIGSGEWGWPEKSPFDAIVITAALGDKVPDELIDQVKIRGVIVAPIGPSHLQTMTRFTKLKSGHLEKEEFQKYVFVPFVKER